MTLTPHHTHARRSATQRAVPGSGLQATLAYGAVVLSGLSAGFLVTVLVVECSMRSASPAVYTQVRLIELKHLDDLATLLLIPALLTVATLALVILRRSTSHAWLVGIVLLLLLTTLAISLSISVPINTEQRGWSVAAPPSNWADIRDRWQLAHLARTTSAGLAFLLIAVRQRPALRTATDHEHIDS